MDSSSVVLIFVRTVFKQEAQFHALGTLRSFAHYVENVCITGFQEKAEKVSV
jgi:hypothetical protein